MLRPTDASFLRRMYTGNESIYTYTFEHQKKPECPVCGGEAIEVTRPADSTLQDLIDFLLEKQDLCVVPVPVRRVPWVDASPQPDSPAVHLAGRDEESLPPSTSAARSGDATESREDPGRAHGVRGRPFRHRRRPSVLPVACRILRMSSFPSVSHNPLSKLSIPFPLCK